MTRIDQFESVFRSASKERFEMGDVPMGRVLVITDLNESDGTPYLQKIKRFLSGVVALKDADWIDVHGEAETVGQLLKLVHETKPDLVCTYRNLHTTAYRWPYTLGDHVEVLTQVGEIPVLVCPRPDESGEGGWSETGRVMAMTDHLAGDDDLVRYAATFTRPKGTLYLSHVEDDAIFDKYLGVIARIPDIETESARTLIRERLLRTVRDYAASCADGLADYPIEVVARIRMGHHLNVYRELVRQDDIQLLVMNAKDDEQLAMHGLAYPLAVELRDRPLLML